jgi:hypothetical protein
LIASIVCGITPSILSSQQPHQMTIRADGTCIFNIDERPARGDLPTWGPATLVHKLVPRRVKYLGRLLDETDWLTAPGHNGPAMRTDSATYRVTVERDGKTHTVTIVGERDGACRKLLTFFRALAHQEFLFYKVNWLGDPEAQLDGLRTLSSEIEALRGDSGRAAPYYEINYRRFEPFADRIFAGRHDARTSHLLAAIKLAGYLKLDRHRRAVAKLLEDRERNIRDESARFLSDLNATETVPALLDVIGVSDRATLALMRMGEPGARALAERIGESVPPENFSEMPDWQRRVIATRWLHVEKSVRVLIGHWDELHDEITPAIVDAVTRLAQSPTAKSRAELRTEYFEQFLRFPAGVTEDDRPTAKRHTSDVPAEVMRAREAAEAQRMAAEDTAAHQRALEQKAAAAREQATGNRP